MLRLSVDVVYDYKENISKLLENLLLIVFY